MKKRISIVLIQKTIVLQYFETNFFNTKTWPWIWVHFQWIFKQKKPLSWCQKMRELCTLQEILAQLTYLITKKGFYVNRNPWGLERYSGLKMVHFSKIGQWNTTISTFFKLSKIKIHSAVDFCWQISSSRIFLQCLLPNQSSMFQDLSLILGSPLTGKLWRKSSLKAPNLMGWKKAQ